MMRALSSEDGKAHTSSWYSESALPFFSSAVLKGQCYNNLKKYILFRVCLCLLGSGDLPLPQRKLQLAKTVRETERDGRCRGDLRHRGRGRQQPLLEGLSRQAHHYNHFRSHVSSRPPLTFLHGCCNFIAFFHSLHILLRWILLQIEASIHKIS